MKEYVSEIYTKVRETEDNFIFETVSSFCNNVAKKEISKEELKQAIIVWKRFKDNDIQEVIHGKWINDSLIPSARICSICGNIVYRFNYEKDAWGSNYCPRCGAKMDLED